LMVSLLITTAELTARGIRGSQRAPRYLVSTLLRDG
jgi:hypothetical protein